MTATPTWLTEGAHPVRRRQIERDYAEMQRRGGKVVSMPPRDTELRRLWLAAAEASEDFAFVASDARATDDRFDQAEQRAEQAERALRDYLLIEHGLTTADLKRSVL